MRIPARFVAVIKKAGVNPYVDLPAEATAHFSERAHRAVLVRVTNAARRGTRGESKPMPNADRLRKIQRLTSDGWFRTTVVPARGKPFRLYLDTWMRKTAGVAVGASVRVTLRPDPEPRELSMPSALRTALSRDAAARRVWESWPPSRRRQALSYLNFLKSNEAIARTVGKLLNELREK